MVTSVFGVLAATVLTALPVPGAVAATGINKQINFQGKVTNTNGTNVANGSYSFTFRLYSVASAGTALWTETKTLTVTDGVFQTNLGSTTALPGSVDFDTDNIYLGMAFNGDPEMTPRIQFTAAPYAFNSDKLQGLSAADFAQLNPGSAQSGSLNVTGSVQAATSLQAPLVDTATAVALNIGTGTATSVTIGRTTTPFLVQGNSSSTFTATSGANTTTVSFATPTANNSIVFPDAGGTVCTTVATTCSATYLTSGSFLAKNAADTSSFAVTAANYLYGFTNSSSAVASGVLRLDNGNNTGSALTVIGSGNPAAGQALILVNAASGVTGNLIDLQVNGTSRFAVNQAGAVTTGSTINGQTISSAASFTGTVTAATSLLAPLLDTASAGTLSIGTANATAINIGNPSSNVATTITGTTAIKPSAGNDSAAAFQVQNASGTGLINVDSTADATNLITNGSFEANTSGWSAKGGATISSSSAQSMFGSKSLDITTTATAQDGAKFPISLSAGTTYSLSIYARGSFSTLALGYSADGTTEATYVSSGNSPSANGWTRFNMTFTPAAVSGSPYVFIKQTSATARTFYVDGVHLTSGSTSGIFKQSKLTLDGAVTSPLVLQPASDTQNAMLIRTVDGTTVFTADTLNNRVGVGLIRPLAKLHVTDNSSSFPVIKGNTTSTGDLLNLSNNDNNVVTVSATGATLIKQATGNDSATAFQVQNAGGTAMMVVDSVSSIVKIAGALDTTTATTLNIGTSMATGVTVGKSGVTLSAPGGVSTSNGNINAGTGTITSGAINGQTISSTASFTGTVQAATSFLAPLHATADVASGTSGNITIRSGNATAGNGSSGNVTLDNGSKNGSGFAGNLYIGNTNAANVNIGRNAATASGVSVSIQGLAATSSLIFNDATNTNQTTIGFTTPTAARSILFPDAGGTLCTTTASTCSSTYQAAGSYLAKNAADTSSSSVAGYLYSFTNSNSGAAGALSLTGAGTNSAFSVTQSGNPGANQAVILATNTNGTPSGNLLDLRVSAGSRFSVDTAGAVLTSSTINGQTISSTANFTGTVTSATGMTVTSGGITVGGNSSITGTLGVSSALTVSAGGASISGGLNNNTGGITNAGAISGATSITASGTIQGGGTFKTADTTASSAVTLTSGSASSGNSGAVSIDSGTATGTAGAIAVAGANASAVTIGRNGTGAPTVAVQGGASSTIQVNNGTNYSLIQFTAPTAQVTYTLGTNGSNTSATICTSLAASCNTTYQPYVASGYLLKSPTSNEASSSNFTGYQYTFTQNSGTSAGNLSLVNSGTNSALLVTAASNPTAGQAAIQINNSNGTPSGNLLDLQKGGVSQFAVDVSGNISTLAGASSGKINGQTISSTASFTGTVTSATGISVTSGGITVGGNSSITGTLGVSNTLTVSAGGASISGGLNNNAGGITNAGAVSGLSSLQYNTNGTLDTSGANSISIGTTTSTSVTVGRAAGTLSLQGSASSSLVVSSGANNMTINFATPTAGGIVYQFGNAPGSTTYQICTSYSASCGTTYASYYANGYVQLNPSSAQVDATTGSTIWLNKNTADTSNLVRLQAANSNVFTVQANGNMTSTGVASLGNGIMTVNPSTFKVNIGSGTPTLGNGTTGALFVSNSAEFASLVRIGDNTNNASFDATTKEVTFSGTARHQKAIRLTAEYAGAVLDAGGQTNVTGTMTAGYDSTQRFGYYKWTSGLASANTFDVVVTVPVPDDWSAWNGNPQFKTYASSIAAGNTVNVISVTRTDGSADTTFTATNITPGSTSTWATYSSKGLDTTGYTAGGNMNIRIRMSSLSNSDIRLADIILPYYSKF